MCEGDELIHFIETKIIIRSRKRSYKLDNLIYTLKNYIFVSSKLIHICGFSRAL